MLIDETFSRKKILSLIHWSFLCYKRLSVEWDQEVFIGCPFAFTQTLSLSKSAAKHLTKRRTNIDPSKSAVKHFRKKNKYINLSAVVSETRRYLLAVHLPSHKSCHPLLVFSKLAWEIFNKKKDKYRSLKLAVKYLAKMRAIYSSISIEPQASIN